jgi:large subunit ribosomal protein L9
MEVVLQEELPGKGAIGEVIRVRDGYFRNYLEPRGIALRASSSNLRYVEDRKRVLQRIAAKELDNAQALAAEMGEVTLTFALKAGENDRLFGSVTNADIAEKLADQGYDVDRRKIVLDEPIRTLGMYTVHVRLGSELTANLKILVEKRAS